MFEVPVFIVCMHQLFWGDTNPEKLFVDFLLQARIGEERRKCRSTIRKDSSGFGSRKYCCTLTALLRSCCTTVWFYACHSRTEDDIYFTKLLPPYVEGHEP